jgi:fructose-bisphosphate aldolase class I
MIECLYMDSKIDKNAQGEKIDSKINKSLLEETVAKLMTKGKGILAADESNGTADTKRLEPIGVAPGEENRRRYRHLFLCTSELEKYVSGVILYNETFWQDCGCDACESGENVENGVGKKCGKSFAEMLTEKGIIPGIKVDTGAKDSDEFPGEKITAGFEEFEDLGDLETRTKKYFDAGARFAKWRAVIKIDADAGLPTDGAIIKNAEAMADYVEICQANGLVPIVEPEVLLNGDHSLETSRVVTSKVVQAVFSKIKEKVDAGKAYLPGIILKTSMVIQGDQYSDESTAEEVANATVRMLKESVPENIGGVVFLSGGQTAVEATTHLDAIVEEGESDDNLMKKGTLPFEIAFSYARALQGSAARIWAGKDENIDAARTEFIERLKLNQLADAGDYDIEMEY